MSSVFFLACGCKGDSTAVVQHSRYGKDFGYYSTGRVLGKSNGKSAQDLMEWLKQGRDSFDTCETDPKVDV